MSGDIGVDVSEDYSTSWLEKVWHHHCDLDDELDELIYTFDDSSVTSGGSLNACSSTSDDSPDSSFPKISTEFKTSPCWSSPAATRTKGSEI